MRLTYLGSGNAFAPQRDWSCVLVNDAILLDAAPSLLTNLKRLRLDPADIQHVFISHFHGDHFFGLPFLLLEYHFMSRTTAPLAVIGPPGVEEVVRRAMLLAYPDLEALGWPRPMVFMEAVPGERQTAEGVAFSAVEMSHGNASLRALGYRLFLDEGVLAYSGDTGMTEAIYDLVEGARVIILEACSEEISEVHLGRRALREILARAPGDAVIFLNHLDVPGSRPWESLNVVIPRDLQTYELAMRRGQPPEVRHG